MRVDIAVFPGVDDLDVFGPLRVLRAAAKRGGELDVRTVSRQERGTLTTACGVRFDADEPYQPGADVLVMPGGGWGDRAEHGAWGEVQRGDWLPLLASARVQTPLLAGVCTGTMLLAHAGVLAGRRANTHHGATADLAALGVVVVNQRVVDDGDVVTSGGVSAGIDLALRLVERLVGAGEADAVAANLEYQRTT